MARPKRDREHDSWAFPPETDNNDDVYSTFASSTSSTSTPSLTKNKSNVYRADIDRDDTQFSAPQSQKRREYGIPSNYVPNAAEQLEIDRACRILLPMAMVMSVGTGSITFRLLEQRVPVRKYRVALAVLSGVCALPFSAFYAINSFISRVTKLDNSPMADAYKKARTAIAQKRID